MTTAPPPPPGVHVWVSNFGSVERFAAAAAKERTSIADTPRTSWYVVVKDGVIAGCAGLYTVRPGIARIKGVYIAPSHRKAGLGTLLTEHLLAVARAECVSLVEALALNPTWYEARGFRRAAAARPNGAVLVRKVS